MIYFVSSLVFSRTGALLYVSFVWWGKPNCFRFAGVRFLPSGLYSSAMHLHISTFDGHYDLLSPSFSCLGFVWSCWPVYIKISVVGCAFDTLEYF